MRRALQVFHLLFSFSKRLDRGVSSMLGSLVVQTVNAQAIGLEIPQSLFLGRK